MKITTRELVQDTIAVHGHAWAAKHFAKRMPFAMFYAAAFGRAPRELLLPPGNAADFRAVHRTCLQVAQVHAFGHKLQARIASR